MSNKYKDIAKRIRQVVEEEKDEGLTLSKWSTKAKLSENYLSTYLNTVKRGKGHRPNVEALAKAVCILPKWLEFGGNLPERRVVSEPTSKVPKNSAKKVSAKRLNDMQWVTAKEASKILKVSVNRVYQLAKEGRIRSKVESGTYFYHKADVRFYKNAPKLNPGDLSPREGKPRVQNEKDAQGDEWISVNEAAKRLNCGPRTVQLLAKNGKIVSRSAKNDKRSYVYSLKSIVQNLSDRQRFSDSIYSTLADQAAKEIAEREDEKFLSSLKSKRPGSPTGTPHAATALVDYAVNSAEAAKSMSKSAGHMSTYTASDDTTETVFKAIKTKIDNLEQQRAELDKRINALHEVLKEFPKITVSVSMPDFFIAEKKSKS